MQSFETDKIKFDAADVDGDKALSLEEYAAFLYPYDFKHMHDTEIDVTLKEMDADKDGSINFKEFLGEGQCKSASLFTVSLSHRLSVFLPLCTPSFVP